MSATTPRAYPWSSLRRLTRDEAIVETAFARWLAVTAPIPASSEVSAGSVAANRLRTLLRVGPDANILVTARGAREVSPLARDARRPDDPHAPTRVAAPPFASTAAALDPHAATCIVHVPGVVPAIEVLGSSVGVRALAQRLLPGPAELPATRPLGAVEQSLWALVVATALEDLGVAAQVWPLAGTPALVDVARAAALQAAGGGGQPSAGGGGQPSTTSARTAIAVGLDVRIGDITVAIEVRAPAALLTRAYGTPPRSPAWPDRVHFALPIVGGRCALARHDLARLVVRDVVTLDRPESGADADLDVLGGVMGVRLNRAVRAAATSGQTGLPAEVATGYVPRDMSLPDEAHVELTVALGTTRLSLRQITELVIGQIVQLERPLAGPFELRAAGRVLGRGELVDVDGELAVRIVSLGD